MTGCLSCQVRCKAEFACDARYRAYNFTMPELNLSSRLPDLPDSAKDIGYVKRVKAKYEAALMAVPHVVGVGIGFSSAVAVHANTERGLALIVNVDGAVDRDKLPKELDGVPVTVRNTGEFKAF